MKIVQNDTNNAPPNYVDFGSKIERKTLPVEEFLSLNPVPFQRFTEGRAKLGKVKKMLKDLRPEHLEVAIAVLTKEDKYFGEVYPEGWMGIENGNTRQLYWKNHLIGIEPMSTKIPKFVYATIYYVDSMEEMRSLYNSFDSMEATEIRKEKLYGILVGIHDYNPKCSKLQKGEFLTALNFSNYCYDQSQFNQPQAKVDQLPYQVKNFLEEIKAFDDICKNPKNWDQALVTAAFMSLKKYGVSDTKLIGVLDCIDSRKMDTTLAKRTGWTHINYEWSSGEKFKNKSTSWDVSGGLKETVAFALYWIDKDMCDSKLSQLGSNWKDTVNDYFRVVHNLNNILNIA
jgi:hypothetical protein